MKTSGMEVSELWSIWSVVGVEKVFHAGLGVDRDCEFRCTGGDGTQGRDAAPYFEIKSNIQRSWYQRELASSAAGAGKSNAKTAREPAETPVVVPPEVESSMNTSAASPAITTRTAAGIL